MTTAADAVQAKRRAELRLTGCDAVDFALPPFY